MDGRILAAVIGILITSLFTAFAYYRKLHHEKVKTKKSILYFLLEYRHLIKTHYVDPHEISKEYMKYCVEYFKKIGFWEEDNSNIEIEALISEFMGNLINNGKPTIDDEFISSYGKRLEELAKDDPFLAHKLRGNESLFSTVEITNEYVDSLKKSNVFEENVIFTEIINKNLSGHTDENVKALLKEIDKDIKTVAKEMDWSTRYKCWKITKDIEKPPINFDGLGLTEELNKMLKQVVETLKSKENIAQKNM